MRFFCPMLIVSIKDKEMLARPAGIVRSAGPAQKVFRLCLLASPCYKL